jgi:hypothetical protein
VRRRTDPDAEALGLRKLAPGGKLREGPLDTRKVLFHCTQGGGRRERARRAARDNGLFRMAQEPADYDPGLTAAYSEAIGARDFMANIFMANIVIFSLSIAMGASP